MTEVGIFLKGLALGFSIAAPVGPIGILCIRRTLADGPLVGFVTGLGAATADAAYGAVAAFGLTAMSAFLIAQQNVLALCGGTFLCWLGARTFFAEPPSAANVRSSGYAGTCLSTLFLTLSNPATILSFVALFAAFGLGESRNFRTAGFFTIGVWLGSGLWWLILSTAVGSLRSRVTAGVLMGINRFSGFLLFGFGLYALWKGFGGR